MRVPFNNMEILGKFQWNVGIEGLIRMLLEKLGRRKLKNFKLSPTTYLPNSSCANILLFLLKLWMSCLCLWLKPIPSVVYLILSSLKDPSSPTSSVVFFLLHHSDQHINMLMSFPFKKKPTTLDPVFSFIRNCPHFLPFTEKLFETV